MITLDSHHSTPRSTPPKTSTLPVKTQQKSSPRNNVQSMLIEQSKQPPVGRTPNVLPIHLSEDTPHPWLANSNKPKSNIQNLILRDFVNKNATFDSHNSSYQSSRSKLSDTSLRPSLATPQPACKFSYFVLYLIKFDTLWQLFAILLTSH